MRREKPNRLWLLLGAVALLGCDENRETRPDAGTEATPTTSLPDFGREPGAATPSSDKGPEHERAWEEGDLPAQLEEKAEPKDGGEVKIQMFAEPSSLDLLSNPDWFAHGILANHVYESLVTRDPYDHPDYRVIPSLAERWERSEDGRTYTFHLRRGVSWHDGKEFTADDVVATFDHLRRHHEHAEHFHPYLDDIARYDAPDSHTVRFHWRRPYFMALEAFAMVPIVPKHALEGSPDLAKHPVGTGPFAFEEWKELHEIVLRRNDEYWGKPPHLERLRFMIVGDSAEALEMARNGKLDVVERVPADRWKEMHDPVFRERFHRSKFFGSNYAFIGWTRSVPSSRMQRFDEPSRCSRPERNW